ncbi:DEAD/DEAH box helicase family protein [Vibrio splendidus]|uniref:DEAD/DEAH box helicase n=1 Tax=Vibrio splendidus TaxID=29497 RepID=UPI001FB1BD84|nr:DEAD/DEAH box helicase [Vibrio splendidus]UOE82177.1 DEAD/DEAH box helicase family protein [Vibrio splendidus]
MKTNKAMSLIRSFNKKGKLYLHEHPPGAGKTHMMVKLMNDSKQHRVTYSAPTTALIDELAEKLEDTLIVTSETVGKATVGKWLEKNTSKLQKAKVVLTTHESLLRYPEYFQKCVLVDKNGKQYEDKRDLVIDELPRLIDFHNFWTDAEDANELKELTREKARQLLTDNKLGSERLTERKANFLEMFARSSHFDFYIEERTKQERKGIEVYYTHMTDTAVWEGFDGIHLMGATLKDTLAYAYFTKIAKLPVGKSTEHSPRGNKMENNVTLVPLTVCADRDFITKKVLKENYKAMEDVVREHSASGEVASITNNDYKLMLQKPFELMPTKAHGLNAWADKTEVAVLYCANPNPKLFKLMSHYSKALGMSEGYFKDAWVEQNFLDVVYQAVTRSAIRVPDSKDDLIFFVPDVRSAEWLKHKLPNATIDYDKGVKVEIDKGGAPVGSANASGDNYKVAKYLKEAQQVRGKKVYRIIDAFIKANGFAPNIDVYEHKVLLSRASNVKSLKGFDWDINNWKVS